MGSLAGPSPLSEFLSPAEVIARAFTGKYTGKYLGILEKSGKRKDLEELIRQFVRPIIEQTPTESSLKIPEWRTKIRRVLSVDEGKSLKTSASLFASRQLTDQESADVTRFCQNKDGKADRDLLEIISYAKLNIGDMLGEYLVAEFNAGRSGAS